MKFNFFYEHNNNNNNRHKETQMISLVGFVFQGDEKGEDGKGKVKVRHIDLPIEIRGHGLSQKDLDNALEKEVINFIDNNRKEQKNLN